MTEIELSERINKMDVNIADLRADMRNLMSRIMPGVEQQAQTIVNLNDRLTRQEERQAFAETRMHETRAEFAEKMTALDKKCDAIEDRAKTRGEANARLIMMCSAAIGTLLAIATFLVTRVQIKP